MSCAFNRLVLESIRAWAASTQSVRAMAQIELKWIEVDALDVWPPFEEFLAIIFFERRRDLRIARNLEAVMTADETTLLKALTVAPWDLVAAARCLRSFLGEVSARAAASAAERVRVAATVHHT